MSKSRKEKDSQLNCPKNFGSRDILVSILIIINFYSDVIAQIIESVTQVLLSHLWLRIVTSSVVMDSTSLLLLLSSVLKSQVLYCSGVVGVFLSVPTASDN